MARKFGIDDLLPPLPKKFYQEKYNDKNWMRGVLRQKKQKWERELPDKLVARETAIANMDQTIIKARPSYKKQLQKRQQRAKTYVWKYFEVECENIWNGTWNPPGTL